MTSSVILGCRAKIRWAKYNLTVANAIWERFVDSEPYAFNIYYGENPEPGGLWATIRFRIDKTPPDDFVIVLGQLVHGLRSALDHLVWESARRHKRRKPTNEERRTIYFPVCRRPRDFRRSKCRPHVSEDAWTRIERHQPYQRRDAADKHPLYVLNELWNHDKHRALAVVMVYPDPESLQQAVVVRDGSLIRSQSFAFRPDQALEHGTEVAHFTFWPGTPLPRDIDESYVEMDEGFMASEAIGDPPRISLELTDFQDLIGYVGQVVDDFDQLFD